MIHPKSELKHINDLVGYGLFATQDIPKGTMVYVRDELEHAISQEDFLKYSNPIQNQIEKYSYIDEKGDRIVSWDFGKYVNHNCQPNTISTGYGFEIAIRDIKKGEEITDEYGIFNLEYEMECFCGAEKCRSKIKPNDFEQYYKAWDKQIKAHIFGVFEVDQPLFQFLDEHTINELKLLLADPALYKSVYSLRYKESKTLSIEKTA
jgi:uncharacterized protein